MKRLFWVLLVGLSAALAGPSLAAAADNDIPGTPMTVGQTVSGTVDAATDPADVYSISLVSGEQVELRLTDSNGDYFQGCDVTLLGPASTSIRDSSRYQWLGSTDSDWNEEGSLLYTPATSGVYYLWVSSGDAGMPYALGVARTTLPPITTPDSNDIFGLAIGVGSVNGVVDEETDPDDVYAVRLFADEPVTITLGDGDSDYFSGCDLDLLAPKSTSIRSSSTYQWLIGTDSDWGEEGRIDYTPAADGTYFLWVSSASNGMPYTVTVAGSAEVPRYPSRMLLRSSATRVARGRYVTISGTLVDQSSALIPGRGVALLRSMNGKTWKKVANLTSSTGRYSKRVRLLRKTWFRLRFAGDAQWTACVSRKLAVRTR